MPFKSLHRKRRYERDAAKRKLATDASFRDRKRARGRARSKALRQAARAIVLQLKAQPCADCHQTFDPVCMDFDHRAGERKRACVSELANKGSILAVVIDEISKCDLVCANCHRLRTKSRVA